MNALTKLFASCSLVGAILIGCLGVVSTQAACSGSTCSSSEEQACTSAYTNCTNEAAASADKNRCEQCVDTYCKCYDSCGNDCGRDKLSGACVF